MSFCFGGARRYKETPHQSRKALLKGSNPYFNPPKSTTFMVSFCFGRAQRYREAPHQSRKALRKGSNPYILSPKKKTHIDFNKILWYN